jgi:uncharacterized protein YdeI (YjbR/CyaY-like superfamily)
MPKKDERVDAYIEKSADFAKPILTRLRDLVHQACPEIEEKMKWSFPNFDYKGPVCSMAGFKQHCTFGFWKTSLMKDPQQILTESREAMGQLGRVKRVEDLPADEVLIAYIKEAVELNEKGIKLPSKPKNTAPQELSVPESLISALEANPSAFETFEKFSYSNKKEYVEWINEAKTDETRDKRLTTAIEWMAEGKPRNWKYMTRK